jgi:hypothetical protein
MLNVILFTQHKFDSDAKAAELLRFLNSYTTAFKLARFDAREPVRQVYQPHEIQEPVRLLSGAPEHRWGQLFLKGSKHKFLAWFRWSETVELAEWHLFMDDAYFRQQKRVDEFANFLGALCEEFPVVFGGAAPEADWEAKHWTMVELPAGGRSRKKLGLNLDACLPGVYWLTVLGRDLVDYFGGQQLQQLPVHRLSALGANGMLLMLRPLPDVPELSERLRHDSEIMSALGDEYFFSIDRPQAECRAVPAVTQVSHES